MKSSSCFSKINIKEHSAALRGLPIVYSWRGFNTQELAYARELQGVLTWY